MIRIVIPLTPVTKKNSQRIAMVRNRPMILPSQEHPRTEIYIEEVPPHGSGL